MKTIYLVICLLLSTWLTTAQSSQRVWNYHLSNIRTFEVVKGDGKIYFLSEGGIFYYNLADNSVNSLSKINGLSGSDIKGIDYSHSTKSLIVFYENSVVDVVFDNGRIYTLADIQRKNISGNKQIYNATCYEGFCYLACGFGIVVIDLHNLEIKDSFIIGDNGEYMEVFDVALDGENIYAGTPKGIKYASLNSPNLLDYSNWHYIESKFVESHNYNMLNYGAGRLWAVHQSKLWHGDRTISRHGEDLWYPEFQKISVVNNLKLCSDYQVLTGKNNNDVNTLYIHSQNTGPVLELTEYPFETEGIPILPRAGIIDDDGTVWIADYNYGAIRLKNNQFDRITPDGPIDNSAFSMKYSNNKLWVAGGGRNLTWSNIYKGLIIQSYSGGKWQYINKVSNPELTNFWDVTQILPYPGNPNRILAATWGGGILEFDNGKLIGQYNEENSTLKNIQPGYYLRVGGMEFDKHGNLWVANSEVEDVLHMKKPDGSWKSFYLPEIAYNYKIGKILVTSKDQVWIIVPRESTYGLYVMSTDGTKRKHLDVVSYFSNGTEEVFVNMNNVFDIVEDNKGRIWVGTSKGVAVYNYPDRIFSEDPFYASQPGVDRKDGIYHPLLAQAMVTSIVVDGGNLKWCGTRNAGLFLISEDGTDELLNYTTDNSSLISNSIISLEYDGKNGIMYVGTERGLVSVQTDSKDAFERFTNVYAYPNPVRSNYQGSIYITGMMENTNVKITTISGRLVYETTSVGGQAVWDGTDYAGNRVHTGVYLALCASEDGQESTVTKIVFIR
jgi:ligand-binding sensor domain-containing protein